MSKHAKLRDQTIRQAVDALGVRIEPKGLAYQGNVVRYPSCFYDSLGSSQVILVVFFFYCFLSSICIFVNLLMFPTCAFAGTIQEKAPVLKVSNETVASH